MRILLGRIWIGMQALWRACNAARRVKKRWHRMSRRQQFCCALPFWLPTSPSCRVLPGQAMPVISSRSKYGGSSPGKGGCQNRRRCKNRALGRDAPRACTPKRHDKHFDECGGPRWTFMLERPAKRPTYLTKEQMNCTARKAQDAPSTPCISRAPCIRSRPDASHRLPPAQ